MAGLAKTNKFLLSTATVMLGPKAQLHNLTPANSIGLVKNFSVNSDPSFTELTQGINNQIVMSVKTNETLSCSMEVYEYTLRNLAYAAGLDGSGTAFDPMADTVYNPTAEIASAATTLTIATDLTAVFTVGSYFYIADPLKDDLVHIAKVSAATFAAGNTTVTFAGFPIATGTTFPVTSKIAPVKKVQVGVGSVQPELACKVVGVLPATGEPFTVLFPKVKITGGVGLAFQSDNFSNMPFEFTPYAQVETDPFWGEYANSSMVLFPR